MVVVMIRIGLILERRRRLLSLRYPRLSATGSGKHTAVEVALARHKDSFIADQRGAVAFEMLIVWLFMVTSLLLPLADVAAAGFQFISAWGALRNFGQSIQYDPPTDFANASGWTSSKLAKADPRFPIQNFQLVCGGSACSANQHRFTQVLFIHDDRHHIAHGVKIGVVYLVLARSHCLTQNGSQ